MQYPALPPTRKTLPQRNDFQKDGFLLLPIRHRFAIGALSSRSPVLKDRRRSEARVAQLVEHMTENHGVGGSIPSPGTISLIATVR